MNTFRTLTVVSFATLTVAAPAYSQSPPVPLPDSRQQFAWFDTLGYPRLAGRSFVRVLMGQPAQDASGKRVPQTRCGFLLSDDGQTFSVFYTDLTTLRYRKTAPGMDAALRVGYDRLLLGGWCTRFLDFYKSDGSGDNANGAVFAGRLDVQAQLFVLARACAANNFPGPAEKICAAAAVRNPTQYYDIPYNAPFDQRIRYELARDAMWSAVLECGEPTISRRALSAKFAAIARRYPDGFYAKSAGKLASALAMMADEDQAHRPVAPDALKRLPEAERANELAFQLRDQNGHQQGDYGYCDIFTDSRGDSSPAAMLLKMGYGAIPALLEHLGDAQPTRSVTYNQSWFFSHRVITVGEAAMTILQKIAGQAFNITIKNGVVYGRPQDEVKARITAWWNKIKSGDERGALAEATARGDQDSGNQAERLIQKYPQSAAEPIAAGLAHATDTGIRNQLVSALGTLTSPEAAAALRHEMETGPDMGVRVSAATFLRNLGDPESIERMLAEWNALDPGKANSYDAGLLARFLVSANQRRTITAVAGRLSQFPAEVSRAAIEAVAGPVAPGQQGRVPMSDPDAQVVPAEQALLAPLLLDTDEIRRTTLALGGASVTDPRICELAGAALHDHWPDRYAFKAFDSELELDQQRFQLYNLWAAGNGLPQQPVPRTANMTAPSQAATERCIADVTSAETNRQKSAAMAALRSLGPGAIPTLWSEADAASGSRQALLRNVAQELACGVARVDVTPEEPALPPGVKTQIDSLVGQAFTSTTLADWFTGVMGQMPVEVTGIEIKAVRNRDGAGVSVTVRLTRGAVAGANAQPGWATYERIKVRNTYQRLAMGFGVFPDKPHPEISNDMRSAIDSALQAPPLDPLSILVDYSRAK